MASSRSVERSDTTGESHENRTDYGGVAELCPPSSGSRNSTNMFVYDAFRERPPRLFLLNVVNELRDASRGHVIDDDVRLGGEALEEIAHAVELCNFPAIVRSNGGPE